MEPAYKRVLLKLSGEALAGDKKTGLDYDTITNIGKAIRNAVMQELKWALLSEAATFGEVAQAVLWTEQELTTWVCSQRLSIL